MNISLENIRNMDSRERGRLINSAIGFKPATLLGTVDEEKRTNLAIISSVFHLGANPALIGIIFRPDVTARHTLTNIRDTGFCTLNHVSKAIYKKAHQTSARYEKDQSEFDTCGLTQEYHHDFIAPFVQESPIQLALKLVEEKEITQNGTHMLIMSIEGIYMKDQYVSSDGNIDLDAADTICVGGLDSYYECSLIERLPYAKPDKSII
jgi:flavin reductase (DIM6/NTAB) family NADH-FMN oxidoreductase RutF